MLRWADEHAPDELRRLVPVRPSPARCRRARGLAHARRVDDPPPARLAAEVAPHAEFAVAQALASPALVVRHAGAGRSVAACGGSSSAWPTPAGCRPTSRPGPARTSSCSRSSPSWSATSVGSSTAPPGGRCTSSRGGRRMRFTNWARRHARPGAGDVGRRGHGRVERRARRPPPGAGTVRVAVTLEGDPRTCGRGAAPAGTQRFRSLRAVTSTERCWSAHEITRTEMASATGFVSMLAVTSARAPGRRR